jgi:hypothetical protein
MRVSLLFAAFAGLGLCQPNILAAKIRHGEFRKWDSVQLSNDLIRLDITPELGGRIMNYQLGPHRFLWSNGALAGDHPPKSRLGPGGAWLNWGGDKLWPAPQGWDNSDQWPGPPDPILDGSPQHLRILPPIAGSQAVQLTSPPDQKTGIQFSRTIRIFDESSHVHVDAQMKNISHRVIRWGIWTDTQLDASDHPHAGMNHDFFTYVPMNPKSCHPQGFKVLYGSSQNPEIEPNAIDHMMRLHFQWIVGKVGIDSNGGWVANVDGRTGYVFVQTFRFRDDEHYPDDSSVEVWTNGIGSIHAWKKNVQMPANPEDNPYLVESELIGPFTTISPGEHSQFSYDWYAANIGGNYPIVACNDVGCSSAEPFVRANGGFAQLRGRFAVFYKGSAWLEFLNERGAIVYRKLLADHLAPSAPLVVSTSVPMPNKAMRVRLVIYDMHGKKVGDIVDASVKR